MNSIASFVGLLWFWSELGMGGMMGWGGSSEVDGWEPGAGDLFFIYFYNR